VLGEFLFRIIVGHPTAIGFNTRLLRAIWTLIVAFCLNWLYVHVDGSVKSTHALRHSIYSAFTWVFMHLPLVASLLAGGHAAATSASPGEYEHPLAWLLCGGLGTGLICLWIIALLNKSDDDAGLLMLSKVSQFGI
jgi:low temperature requirement protein LtrA